MNDDEKTEAERLDPREFVDQDDPRYNGFRIREWWMATAVDPADNTEGPLFVSGLMAQMFNLMPGPAMAADERRLHNLRDFAAWSAAQYGTTICIRHFKPEGDPEIIIPQSGGIGSD
jgi:hypothetical protein